MSLTSLFSPPPGSRRSSAPDEAPADDSLPSAAAAEACGPNQESLSAECDAAVQGGHPEAPVQASNQENQDPLGSLRASRPLSPT
jgi:hypothetical protein